jgi:thiopurine S-methyltransferase
MDPNFWLERWQKHEIGFHQTNVQPALRKFWPRLKVTKGATVFVPLCGKTIDMTWLADEGYRVIGAELSELAVDEFFAERGVSPEIKTNGAFKIKSAGAIELWCGDYFQLDTAALPDIDALYDRAALVAMPPSMQSGYAEILAKLLPAGARGLLIGLDYNTDEMNGPPFAVPQSRVQALLSPAFDVEVWEARDGLAKSDHLAKRGVTRLEEVSYLLARRA